MFVFKAAVVGAGTMGADIAHVIASAGVPAVREDSDAARVKGATVRARSLGQAQAPLAAAEIKRVSGAEDLEAGLCAEKDAFVTAFASDDAREGIAAFLGKRAAHWKGA